MSLRTLRKTMSENYKIISKFIKDISGETPNIETYLYVKDLEEPFLILDKFPSARHIV